MDGSALERTSSHSSVVHVSFQASPRDRSDTSLIFFLPRRVALSWLMCDVQFILVHSSPGFRSNHAIVRFFDEREKIVEEKFQSKMQEEIIQCVEQKTANFFSPAASRSIHFHRFHSICGKSVVYHEASDRQKTVFACSLKAFQPISMCVRFTSIHGHPSHSRLCGIAFRTCMNCFRWW